VSELLWWCCGTGLFSMELEFIVGHVQIRLWIECLLASAEEWDTIALGDVGMRTWNCRLCCPIYQCHQGAELKTVVFFLFPSSFGYLPTMSNHRRCHSSSSGWRTPIDSMQAL
jgi:hypothetical protein